MQPMKPEDQVVAESAFGASPAEVMEYERLLSERFMIPPTTPATAPLDSGQESLESVTMSPAQQIENRLRELHQKIYGGQPDSGE